MNLAKSLADRTLLRSISRLENVDADSASLLRLRDVFIAVIDTSSRYRDFSTEVVSVADSPCAGTVAAAAMHNNNMLRMMAIF